MKQAVSAILFLVLAVTVSASFAIAQDGSIEFVARATPSGGLEEPVRGFPFFLLNRSFEDITKEADAAFPKLGVGEVQAIRPKGDQLRGMVLRRHRESSAFPAAGSK